MEASVFFTRSEHQAGCLLVLQSSELNNGPESLNMDRATRWSNMLRTNPFNLRSFLDQSRKFARFGRRGKMETMKACSHCWANRKRTRRSMTASIRKHLRETLILNRRDWNQQKRLSWQTRAETASGFRTCRTRSIANLHAGPFAPSQVVVSVYRRSLW